MERLVIKPNHASKIIEVRKGENFTIIVTSKGMGLVDTCGKTVTKNTSTTFSSEDGPNFSIRNYSKGGESLVVCIVKTMM